MWELITEVQKAEGHFASVTISRIKYRLCKIAGGGRIVFRARVEYNDRDEITGYSRHQQIWMDARHVRDLVDTLKQIDKAELRDMMKKYEYY